MIRKTLVCTCFWEISSGLDRYTWTVFGASYDYACVGTRLVL